MLRKLLFQTAVKGQKTQKAKADDDYRNLIRKEAIIGGTLFGPIPKGHRREFFCLDEHTWVWHEEWVDKLGHKHVLTTRYDVRPDCVVKVQNGQGYQALSPTEARNFREAVQLYYQKVTSQLYNAAA